MGKAKHGVEVESEVSEIAKRYVDYYMAEDITFIFDKIGMDMPTKIEGEYFETEMADARTFAEGYFTENPDEMTDKFGNPFAMKDGGGVKEKSTFRTDNSSSLMYANFNNFTAHINLIKLKAYKTRGYGQYKDENKYAISISGFSEGRNILKFKTLEEAEKRFEELVNQKKSQAVLDNMGKTANYNNGGEIKFKKINQFGNETTYQATDGETTIPYSITRIRDNKGTLLRMDSSKTGLFETYSMDEVHDKIKSLFMEKAADGTEIDEMVNDWKSVKKALGGGGGMFDPKKLKAYDEETKSVHNIIKIDYDDDLIVMESKQYGRTKNDLSKVKLFFEAGTEIQIPTIITTPTVTKAVTKDANVTHTPIITPTIIETAVKKEIPLAPSSKGVVKVGQVDKRKERFSKILQEMWAEAKGTGLTLVSPEYMLKMEESLISPDTPYSTYEEMILQVMTWLIDNEIILRSKPFMKKIRTAFEDTQTM
jgi:hypothetical protein